MPTPDGCAGSTPPCRWSCRDGRLHRECTFCSWRRRRDPSRTTFPWGGFDEDFAPCRIVRRDGPARRKRPAGPCLRPSDNRSLRGGGRLLDCGGGLYLRLSAGDHGDDATRGHERREARGQQGADGAHHQAARISRRLVHRRHGPERRHALYHRLHRRRQGAVGVLVPGHEGRPLLPLSDAGRLDDGVPGAGIAHDRAGGPLRCDHRPRVGGQASRRRRRIQVADEPRLDPGTHLLHRHAGSRTHARSARSAPTANRGPRRRARSTPAST